MTNVEFTQANSVQLLLCKMITSLTQPATTCIVSQMKKVCLKQPVKALSSKEMQNKHMEQCTKNKHLFDFIYSIAPL